MTLEERLYSAMRDVARKVEVSEIDQLRFVMMVNEIFTSRVPELFDGKHKIVPVEPTKDKSSEGFAGLPERYQPTTKAAP